MKNNQDFNKCDVCGIEGDDVLAGRWIFYCPKHKDIDKQKTYDNEIAPALEDGDFSYFDGELSDILEEVAK